MRGDAPALDSPLIQTLRWLLILLSATLAPVQAHAQALPKGMLEARPQAWETETAQAGGRGQGRYLFVGTLRCKNAGEGIVGTRMLRSQVVDLLQIGCARPECADDNDCGWKQLDRGAYAGKPSDKSESAIAVCPQDSMISGYRARLKLAGSLDYVADLQFECALVIGPPMGAEPGSSDGGVPVSDIKRSWLPIPAADHAASTPPDTAPWAIEAHCAQRAATGMSVAVGVFTPTGQPAIQALSLFCSKVMPLTGSRPSAE